MEFHIARKARERYNVDDVLFNYRGNVVFANLAASRDLAHRVNAARTLQGLDPLPAASLFAMGLIDELSHAMMAHYRATLDPHVLSEAIRWFAGRQGTPAVEALLAAFAEHFPSVSVHRGEHTPAAWLAGSTDGIAHDEAAFEELLMLWLANHNPAFAPFAELFDPTELRQSTVYESVTATLDRFFATRPPLAPEVGTLLDALRAPMLAAPHSLAGQLEYIRDNWAEQLGEDLHHVLLAVDVVKEEDAALWQLAHPAGSSALSGANAHGASPNDPPGGPAGGGGWRDEGFVGDEFTGFGPGGVALAAKAYGGATEQPTIHEYEAFSVDQEWMPTVVLIAKSTYVWLEQLSKKYGRHIQRLDQIPDEELALLADRGLNGLWLIGLWQRSPASQTIKRMRGQADAVASAYSVADYRIADDLGGDDAYRVLRDKAAAKGLRLASDMVPNHMGLDSAWVIEHPEWFLSVPQSPFPVYSFNGPDLSNDPRVEIKIEDHYFDMTDAAVVFRRREQSTGETRFVYHGNDGTTFAWNDTAQLDYSKAFVRKHVMQTILAVARLFPIIRFDAAMVLAKKHVQRLWFPIPGTGGSIPSRAEHAISNAEFDALMPNEFWREVVDRVAVEVPGTLLLAEAFWLLEGYFVRTLGMHRVYNSAFMNMLRDEENAKYRSYLKKTIEFDPDILKRYVNFMSNPDERTAIDQFGTGDRYFGVATLLATLPGLPMFGHGQIEAFTEKYGMEYKTAKFDEWPNEELVARHQREIAPLLKNRTLYAESEHFVLYDVWKDDGTVDEDVYAYSNRRGEERAVILFHNRYAQTRGTIHWSAASMEKRSGQLRQRQIAEALDVHQGDGRVVAWKDATTGLEYLRHAWQVEQRGLTFDLRAYQYAVLGEWRELQSTTEQPWDRLCDALGGAGVYRLDEAIATLRLRPVHEALRRALAPAVLRDVLAAENAAPSLLHATPDELEQAALDLAPVDAEARAGALDPALVNFGDRIEEFLRVAGETLGREDSPEREVIDAELSGLPFQGPNPKGGESPLAVHAPLFAWTIIRLLPGGVAAFDTLQLRKGLAEVLPSLGLEGETAWRTAALLRVLLAHFADDASTPLEDDSFWADADVHWLAGITVYQGKRFLHREHFEEMLGALRSIGAVTAPEAEERIARAKAAGYDVALLFDRGQAETVRDTPVTPAALPEEVAVIAADPDDGALEPPSSSPGVELEGRPVERLAKDAAPVEQGQLRRS